MLREDFATWQCGDRELSLARPRIMGVLNVTPDSFSDGGQNFDADLAIARGLELLDQGADIVDVGGESTRPGFVPVDPDEEARRVLPVIRALARAGALVSVDTRHASVAAMALRDDSVGLDEPGLADEERLAVVLGTEGEGLADATIERCDCTVRIPMAHGVDSLNVAAASAVAFYQLTRR